MVFRYSFVLFSYDYVGTKTYSLGFDFKVTPTLMPKIMDVFGSNLKVLLVFVYRAVDFFDGGYGVIEVNANEPKRQRKTI